jgi:endo-1,4-beta-xylanase
MTISRTARMLHLTCLSLAVTGLQSVAAQTTAPSLKETFRKAFLVGTAINAPQIAGRDTAAARLLPQQFNAVTPENAMKADALHPQWGTFYFDLADQLVAYAQQNNLKVNAHTLIWHSQLPGYLRNMQDADSVRQYLETHIRTVAGRYKGKVYSWDVVNEALNEDGTLRNSIFLQKLGEGYIVQAFRLAQQAAPGTRLYYNDYNIEQPQKRAGALALIKKIQAAGVRIDGVGIQGHWQAGKVPMADIEASIREFGALGIEVMFTELDLSVLPNPFRNNTADVGAQAAYNASINPYTSGLPDSMQQVLTTSYADLFTLFLKYNKQVSRVTFWGIDDGHSWLNNWPVRGRTNYPLLFDRQYQPKPAFYRIIALMNK